METCLFCEIIKGTIPSHTVYETDTVRAFLDIHPVNPGHTILVPKTHAANYLEGTTDMLADLAVAIQKLAPAVLRAVNASAFNVAVNCGRDADQVIFHLHWHIIPRFSGDGHKVWKGKAEYEAGLPEVAEKIRQAL